MTTQGRSRNKDIARNGKKWAPATCNRYKALISMVYREGIKNGKVSVNPARQVERRRENNQRDRFLSPQEEKAVRDVISAARPERMPEFDIALHTGMRRGEQYACEWSWIALDRKVLTVPRSKHGEKRRVFLNDTAIAAFRSLWQFSKGMGKVFAHLYNSDETVGARGWFESTLNEAKVEDFRWHDLRHSFASRLVMAGVDIRTVQELMGHKTIQVTLRYAHLAPQHQLEAVQRLCDTDGAVMDATDTRTDTGTIKSMNGGTIAVN